MLQKSGNILVKAGAQNHLSKTATQLFMKKVI